MFATRAALLRKDYDKATADRPEMVRLCLAGGTPLASVEALLISAEVLRWQGETQKARAHLDDALEIACTTGSPYFEFMARLTEAYLYFDRGDESEGLRTLGRAMVLGRAGGYVNSFVWQPAVMAKLCTKALEAGIETAYAQGLIRRRRLVPEEPPIEIEAWPWPVKIYTLGRFEVRRDDQPLQFAGKVQRKPLALLKAIIAFGGRRVREELVTDALWPDADGDAARFALTSAIHRLRRLLGHEDALVRKDNEVGLDDRHCWVDAWAVECLLTRAERSRDTGSDCAWTGTIRAIERAAELYRGSFLGSDGDVPWATALTDRIRRRLLRQLLWVGQNWEERKLAGSRACL